MAASSDDIRSIARRSQDAWNEAFNRGDAAAVAGLYADDAMVLPPSHVIIRGAAAIRDFWHGLIAAGVKEHGITLIEAEADGGLAFAAGRWWAAGPGDDGKSEQFGGTVVTILRRRGDGFWTIGLHTWN
jgi:uncharacterized protein (TIGR02246 family)